LNHHTAAGGDGIHGVGEHAPLATDRPAAIAFIGRQPQDIDEIRKGVQGETPRQDEADGQLWRFPVWPGRPYCLAFAHECPSFGTVSHLSHSGDASILSEGAGVDNTVSEAIFRAKPSGTNSVPMPA
jgi:hypothetical protein